LERDAKLSDDDRETIIRIVSQSLARYQPEPEPASGPEVVSHVDIEPEPGEKS
jgi:hypothetical protein